MRVQRKQDDENKLIRTLLDPTRAASDESIQKILDRVHEAPFRESLLGVKMEIRGRAILGRQLRAKEPSIIAHLAKRVLAEGQWADGTTPEQYLNDLRSVANDPEVRMAVYRRKDKGIYLGLLAPNRLPLERLGPRSEKYLWVVYSADYGTIITGYQVSAVAAIDLPEEVRWL